MANLWDKIKQVGRSIDKAVIRPVVEGVKNPLGQLQKNTNRVVSEAGEFLDENIGRPITNVTKDVKRATGLEATPTPESVKPKVNQNAAAAMSQYGKMVTGQAGQFDPSKYGPNTFQPRSFTPTQTANAVNLPGTYQATGTPTAPTLMTSSVKTPAPRYSNSIPTPISSPQQPAVISAPSAGQQIATPQGTTSQAQIPNAPQMLSASGITPAGAVAAPVNNVPAIQSPVAPTMQNSPQAQQITTTPQLQNVSGVPIGMQNYNQQVDTSQEQAAVRQELSRLSNPTQLQSGYDPKLRQTYVDMATSGLQQQKEQAIAQLKEEQMKAGNYGSSVGQKAMSDLQAQYDRQVSEAGKQADLMQMEAEREDRYKNVSVDQNRAGLLTNVAGAGANLNLSSQGFSRDTTSLQNQAEALKAQYAQQGIQIDNATAMQMAQFSSSQNQQDFSNKMAQTGMNNQNIQQMFQNQMSAAGFNTQQAQQQFVNEMTRAGFTSDEAQKLFQNQMTGLNFNAGQQQQEYQNQVNTSSMRQQQEQQQFVNEMAKAGFSAEEAQRMYQNQITGASFDANQQQQGFSNAMAGASFSAQQAQQAYQNQMSNLGFNTSQDQQQFQNQMTNLGFNAGQQQQGFQNQMNVAQMNQANQMAGYESDWRRYAAGQDQARYTDSTQNQAGLFNIGQADTADVRNYGVYQDAARNLAAYGSNQIDPASEVNYRLWLQEQQDKNARLGATIGAVGTVAGAAMSANQKPVIDPNVRQLGPGLRAGMRL